MTIDQIDAVIIQPFINALADGKAIQVRRNGKWVDVNNGIDLTHISDYPDKYRIKPISKVYWIGTYSKDPGCFMVCESQEEAEELKKNPDITFIKCAEVNE